jgi:gas vesicle protein
MYYSFDDLYTSSFDAKPDGTGIATFDCDGKKFKISLRSKNDFDTIEDLLASFYNAANEEIVEKVGDVKSEIDEKLGDVKSEINDLLNEYFL